MIVEHSHSAPLPPSEIPAHMAAMHDVKVYAEPSSLMVFHDAHHGAPLRIVRADGGGGAVFAVDPFSPWTRLLRRLRSWPTRRRR